MCRPLRVLPGESGVVEVKMKGKIKYVRKAVSKRGNEFYVLYIEVGEGEVIEAVSWGEPPKTGEEIDFIVRRATVTVIGGEK